jgi:hypothetical protein
LRGEKASVKNTTTKIRDNATWIQRPIFFFDDKHDTISIYTRNQEDGRLSQKQQDFFTERSTIVVKNDNDRPDVPLAVRRHKIIDD